MKSYEDGFNEKERTHPMSFTEIQSAVISIRMLPPADRLKLYRWAMAEMEPEASHAAFEQAFKAGCYDQIIAETDQEYERGEALASKDSKMSKIYRRKDLAKEYGVHVNTIYRLEKEGKLPKPGRLKHNHECIYRDEHKEALEKYLTEEEEMAAAIK